MTDHFRTKKTNLINAFIIVIIMHLIDSSEYFKSYQLANEDILIIDKSGILVKELSAEGTKTIVSFDGAFDLSSSNNFYDVALSQFPSEKGGLIICYVKQNLYIISSDYQNKYTSSLQLNAAHVIIIPYDSVQEGSVTNYYYFICFILQDNNNNAISVLEYYYNIDTCQNNLKISNNITSINSLGEQCKTETLLDRIDCELMYNNIITCFTKNTYPTELAHNSFDINNNLQRISKFSGTTKTNSGANKIKSALSGDKKRALVCRIDDQNYICCQVFDITKNEWSDDVKIFSTINDQDALKLKYIEEKKEYVLFNRKSNTAVDMVIFDENFKVKTNNEEIECGYVEESLSGCNYLPSYDIYYSNKNKNYFTLTGCDSNGFVNYTVSEKSTNSFENSIILYNGTITAENITNDEKKEIIKEEKEKKEEMEEVEVEEKEERREGEEEIGRAHV